MPKYLFAALLAIQAHFAASYLVPLDSQAQREFGGLLRWAWPWSDGDSGPLGEVTATSGVPFAGLVLAMIAGLALIMAALAVAGIWVPTNWWRSLVVAGTGAMLALMVLFLGPTKLIPIAIGVFVLWYTVRHWETASWATTTGE